MARRRRRASLKRVIREIRSSQKAVRTLRTSAATRPERQRANLHLVNLRVLERIAKAMCRQDFLDTK